jgi:hypothetical protein
VPLQGHFTCPQAEIAKRDRYNNHPVIGKNFDAVEEKFAKEEQKSFHIHLPRFSSGSGIRVRAASAWTAPVDLMALTQTGLATRIFPNRRFITKTNAPLFTTARHSFDS